MYGITQPMSGIISNHKNKLLNKLPLILLCTIRIDDSLLIAVSYHSKVATRQPDWTPGLVPDPFGIYAERLESFQRASNKLSM